jgi:plastocyanin
VNRLLRRATPIAVMLVLFLHVDAFAATKAVTIADFSFTPSLSKLHIGDGVQWTNNGPSTHTTTSNAPFSLWDSGNLTSGQTFSWPFNAAGIFPYHCSIHTFMTGNIGVLGFASPSSGAAGTQFGIHVSKITAPPQFLYDVQMKAPGGNWADWMTGITVAVPTWDSTGAASGQYQFRSRLRRISDGSASGYSPAIKVTVT